MPAPTTDAGLFAVPFPPAEHRRRRRSRPAPTARLIPGDAEGERAFAEHNARRRHPSAWRRLSTTPSEGDHLQVVR